MEKQFLDIKTLEMAIKETSVFETSFLFEEAKSSNDIAKEMIKNGSIRSGVIVVNRQTKGRGRTNKKWVSDFGSCLTFSLVLDKNDIKLPSYSSLLAAEIVHRTLISYEKIRKSDKNLSIKWPNDIYAGNKKISGILTELIFEGSELKNQIIGIGLNFSGDNFNSDDLKDAGSISSVYGFTPNLDELFIKLLTQANEIFKINSFDPSYINTNSFLNGKTVKFTKNNRQEIASVLRVDTDGHLLLRLQNSELYSLSSGSVFLFN